MLLQDYGKFSHPKFWMTSILLTATVTSVVLHSIKTGIIESHWIGYHNGGGNSFDSMVAELATIPTAAMVSSMTRLFPYPDNDFILTANFSAPAMEQLAAISSFFEVFQWQKQVNYLQYDPIQYIPKKIIR